MYLDYNDPISWLDHRYACDVQARNPHIEENFLSFFRPHESVLHITDVGAGTGANVCYYFDKLKHQQEWTLIEQNGTLLQACRERLRTFAEKQQYFWEEQEHEAQLIADSKKALIRFIPGNVDNIEQLTDLEQADVVMGNAFFDLISFDQFDALIGKLVKHHVSLLATLNYYETSFYPFCEEDHQMMRWYHMHMKRPQPFGISMGANCSEEMLDLLAQHHMLIEQEASQWHLKRGNTTMQHYILHFIEHALSELSLMEEEREVCHRWMAKRKEQLQNRTLEIIIDHSDIFATE